MYRLIIEDDEGRKSVVPVSRSEVTVGRREGNTIRLNERNVSRTHARLVEEQSSLFLEDAGSRFGVKVNGERILNRILLRPGDDVVIGDYHLSVLPEEGATLLARGGSLLAREGGPERLGDVARKPTLPDTSPGGVPFHRLGARFENPATAPRLLLGGGADGSSRQEVLLLGPRNTLGRTTDNDVVILHPSIHRRHALILWDGDQVKIQVAEGVDGVRINDQLVRRVALQDGDHLEIGAVPLLFRLPAARPVVSSLVATEPTIEAEALPRRPRRPWPLFLGGGLLALGLLVFFFWPAAPGVPAVDRGGGLAPSTGDPSGSDPGAATPGRLLPTPQAALPGPNTAVPPSPGGLSTPAPGRGPTVEYGPTQLALDLEKAKEALDARQWDSALATLEAALDRGGSGSALESFFVRARAEKAAQQQLARARELAAEQTVEEAFLAARRVPEASIYRQEADELAGKLQQRIVQLHLERGRQQLAAGKASLALEEYQAALALAPQNRRAQQGERLASEKLQGRRGARGGAGRAVPPPEPIDPALAPAPPAPPRQVLPSPPPPPAPGPSSGVAQGPPATPTPPPKPAGNPSTVGAAPPDPPRPPLTRRDEAIQLFERGRQLWMKGKIDEAESVLRQATTVMPGYAEPYLTLALIYSKQSQRERALSSLRQFLLIAPNDPRRPKVEGMMKALAGTP